MVRGRKKKNKQEENKDNKEKKYEKKKESRVNKKKLAENRGTHRYAQNKKNKENEESDPSEKSHNIAQSEGDIFSDSNQEEQEENTETNETVSFPCKGTRLQKNKTQVNKRKKTPTKRKKGKGGKANASHTYIRRPPWKEYEIDPVIHIAQENKLVLRAHHTSSAGTQAKKDHIWKRASGK